MDQYPGSLPTTSSYSSLPSIAPQQLQHNAPLPPHTLPPLQAQHASMSMHSMYQPMSAPHTPTTSTPNTPGPVGNGGYQQMNSQPGPRGYHPGGSYQQPIHSYNNTSSSMMPQASTAMSHPQAIAPAPAPSHARGLVPLRPNTSSAPLHTQHAMHSHLHAGLASPYGQQQHDEAPTHVVGSQGRRGILPSAPGHPTVGATVGGSTKHAPIPAKDADGKFPCPHCTKTYLHAKHLKRHLLRHTGDRPYMCVLCKDTFSRSDILKRHFQKCSIRRGNPTGATHLEFAQSHLKKSHPGAQKNSNPSSTDGDMTRNMNGHNMPTDSNTPIFGGMIPDGRIVEAHSNMGVDEVAQSRANGLKRLSNGGAPRDRRSLTGPGPSGSNRASFDQNYNGDVPTSLSSSINPQLAAFALPNGHNGSNFGQNYDFASQSNGGSVHPQEDMANGSRGVMYGQQWGVGEMFTPGAQDGYMSPFNSNLVQNQMAIKAETSMTNSTDNLFTGMYSIQNPVDSSGESFPIWALPLYQNDPITVEQIALQTADFCCPPGAQGPRIAQVRSILSVDNFKQFMELFSNFQGHFPIIHMPTFRISDTYQGLLLAMACIGSVYSDRVSAGQVRELMEQARMIIERDSHVFQAVTRDSSEDPSFGYEMFGRNKRDLEEIQAIFLLHSIFTWHGTPVQREMARRKFPTLAKLARIAGLTRASTSSQSFSVLHQSTRGTDGVNSANFDWNAWIQQEKRSRIFFTIFLCDTAMCLYFSSSPNFDGREITLPLPADDAAWEARSAEECASALGLPGSAVNPNFQGNGRTKQPELKAALRDLMDPSLTLSLGTTNLLSKFILVHSLCVLIWRAQRLQLQDMDNLNSHGQQGTRSGTSTPISQHNDWTARGTESTYPNSSSNQRVSADSGQLRAISSALDKWKRTWDEDMPMQYPPSSNSLRRFGFCRDGIHFYYLGKYLIKFKLDPQMAPDQRFSHVIHLLKSLKKWAVTDSAQRGEEPGSVGDIDKDYGVTDLTLDMAQLFKPINSRIDSPIPGVHTNIRSGLI